MNTGILKQVAQACWIAAVLMSSHVQADTFEFKDGRQVTGKVLNESEVTVDGRSVKLWAVQVDDDMFVRILESELVRNGRDPLNEFEIEYAEQISKLEDSTESHYEIAKWCASKGLKDLARAHFLRVLDFDPNHSPARVAAGFRQDASGQWVLTEKIMEDRRGKILFKGRWRFPEAVAIEQAQEESEKRVLDLTGSVLRWHREASASSGKRQADALLSLQQISDPALAETIGGLLLGTQKLPIATKTPPSLEVLYTNLLIQFQTPVAAQFLAKVSVIHENIQLRQAALQGLQGFGRDHAQPVLLGYLKSDNNAYINRAGEGLSRLGGEESILPLIQAVVSIHERTVGGGNTTYSGEGMSMGGKPQKVKFPMENGDVLGALTAITGQSFGFDKDRWMTWYSATYGAPVADLFRDP